MSQGDVELPPLRPYPPFNRWVLLPIGRAVARALFWILGPIRSRGAYRIPRDGPLLILANHRADVDPAVVQIACPRAIHFMAKSELFEMPVLRVFMRMYQAFPVKRGEPDRASMRRAIDLLKLGEAVGVFPEGQLTETGELQPLKPGIALIVRQSGAPVLCCGLRNTEKVMPYGRVIPRFSWTRVEVQWGEVHQFGKEATTEEILAWAEGQLRELTDSS